MQSNSSYKETEVGLIPKDWSVFKVDNIGEVRTGGTPSMRHPEYFGGNVKWIRSGDIHLKRIYDVEGRITEEGVTKSNAKILPSDSIMIALNGRGKTRATVAILKTEATCNQSLAAIIINEKDKIIPEYLYYNLENRYNELRNLTGDNERSGLNLRLIKNISIAIPNYIEQKKIVEVLSTADLAIKHSNEIIDKVRSLKQGLIHNFLQKGIGHKKFKDTEIGNIPQDWEIVEIKGVISEAKMGFASGKRDENGIIQFRMNNISSDGRIVLEQLLKVPIPENINEFLLRSNDILFNNTNSVELIGKSTIFSGELDAVTFSNHITRIRANEEKIKPEWLLFNLLQKWELGYFKTICRRHVGQAGIRNSALLATKLPLPSKTEQEQIIDVLNTISTKLLLELKRRKMLETIKIGLLKELISGTKRLN